MNENANLFSEFLVAHLIYLLLQEYPSISGIQKNAYTRYARSAAYEMCLLEKTYQ